MERNAKFLLTALIVFLVIGTVGGYAYSRSKTYIRGPQLTIEVPRNGETVTAPLLTVKGTATNISFLLIDGEQSFVNDIGVFFHTLLLAPGYNILEIAARDRFGRTVKKTLELLYKPTEASVASSTAPSVIPAKAGIQ